MLFSFFFFFSYKKVEKSQESKKVQSLIKNLEKYIKSWVSCLSYGLENGAHI